MATAPTPHERTQIFGFKIYKRRAPAWAFNAAQRTCAASEAAERPRRRARGAGGNPRSASPGTERSYVGTLCGMSADRVTVSLPEEIRRGAQRLAEERGVSFSSVVSEALGAWLRGRLVDSWLAEHQREHGAFDEDELRALAAEAGVPYLAPGRAGEPSALQT